MNLIYTKDKISVCVKDICTLSDGRKVEIIAIQEPHKPESTGRVHIKTVGMSSSMAYMSYFPNVIGAEWINREDQ